MPIQTIMTTSGNRRPIRGVLKIRHVGQDFFGRIAEKHALVQPEHVAGGQDHADGGEHGPLKLACAAPCNTRYSPTKLFNMGRPMLARR